MKEHHWNSRRMPLKNIAQTEKQERKRSLIEKLTRLKWKGLGTVVHSEPSLVDALSLVRARDLER